METLIHNPLSRFLIQAFLIIACARLVGMVARRLEQPMVIAEVTAGILLGPSLFGWLFPDTSAVLFAQESLPLLKLVSEVGLIVFMFLIGLELDPKLLRGRGHASVIISHTSIIVPFALGGLLALYLYPRLSQSSVPFMSFTLFMGVAMSITAFPVLARILTERRLLGTKVGALTITCAAVDDVTAWCILAFVVSIARATGLVGAVWTTVFAVAYIAGMMFVVRPFLARLGERGSSKEGLSQDLVAVTLLLLIVSSWTTEMIGIHPLFGAFMLGAIMPKGTGFAHSLAEKLEDFAVVFLLPLFFAYSGLRTQIGLLNSADGWIMCGLIIVVACAGKFGGSAVAARLTGQRWREASALGILMNTRGLMELIVLNLGLDLGIISPTLFTMMVLMALVTTFMTTPLLRWIYPPEELAKELADVPERTPLPAAADVFTVLMCVSYERSGPGMVTLASALAGHGPEARRLYALRLIPPTDRGSFYLDQGPERQGAAALAPLLSRAKELGAEVRPLSFVSPKPSHDICNVADVKQADLVLVGWHKPLLSQTVLGGTVYEVMRGARTDVGVLIDRGLTAVRKLLVPFHGTAHDKAALALARRLAQQVGADVTILHVVKPKRTSSDALGAQDAVDEVFEGEEGGALRKAKVVLKVVEHDSPADAALEESKRGYDLVLVGVGAEWGLAQRRFGIRAEDVIQGCPTSLLVVRSYEPAAARAPAPAPSAPILSAALAAEPDRS
ncbi:potassium transporter [Sorangium cellulosum]|uniref:Potassium transporter n=1 Tax=Sorangium cellulosum TaxID=56 RepID=A0A150RY49_SORCE|nr:potassium transporter [Sorangium cellulosum]KYF97982.1 potassium transporter [Sorangium cellulosum]